MPKGVYERTPETRAAMRRRRLSPVTRAKISVSLMRPSGWFISEGRCCVRIVSGRLVSRAHVVWVQAHGPIPEGWLIHHEDEDTLNDELSNLRCWTRAEHTRHHNNGRWDEV